MIEVQGFAAAPSSQFVKRRLALIGVCFAMLALAACEEQEQSAPDIVRSVKTIEIGERAAASERQLAGRLAAARLSELSFAVSGTVKDVLVDEGVTVAAGQVLALMDTQTFDLGLTAARAQLNAARATFEERRLEYDRQSALFERGIAARAALDRAEAGLRTARADVEAAQSQVDRASRDVERTTLSAPFSGTIAQKLIEPFQEVSSGQPAFVLEGADGLQAELLVPETMIRQVAYGDRVALSFPTVGNAEATGTITEIGSRMDAGNAFPVIVRLDDTADGAALPLRAGMTVRATFALSSSLAETGFLIPISAIAAGQRDQGSSVETAQENREAPVYVFDPTTETVRRVLVSIGDLRGNRIEVFNGLSPGDRVVVAGVAFLHDGMRARLWSPDL